MSHLQTHYYPARPLPKAITDRIPLELNEMIIDDLAHDLHTLTSCALVCRAWLPRSRLHIFYAIVLEEGNFDQFFALLNSYDFDAHVRSRVHSMTINPGSPFATRWTIACISCLDGFFVKSLTIAHISLSPFETTLAQRMMASFHSVTELVLDFVRFSSFAQALETITILRNLELLSLIHLQFHEGAVVPVVTKTLPVGYSLPPQLHKMELEFRNNTELYDMLRWLANHSAPLPRVHTLSLCADDAILRIVHDFHPSVATVLTRLGTALRHLTISHVRILGQGMSVVGILARGYPYILYYYALTEMLSFNTELRTFHVKDINLLSQWRESDPLKIMPPMIGIIASANIHKITFSVCMGRIWDLNNFDWAGMRRAFSRPEFTHLDRIEFHVPMPENEAPHRIREGLPECVARGIVYISQGPSY